MLIELKVKNFLSFKEETIFSMEKSQFDGKTLPNNSKSCNAKNGNKFEVLKSSLIFGPNASGKSNLLKALGFIRNLVLSSRNYPKDEMLKYNSFKLNKKTREEEPIEISIKFLKNKSIYEYSLSLKINSLIDKNYNFIVVSEILKKNGEFEFKRNQDRVKSNNKIMDLSLEDLQTNKNALFLSKSEVLGFNDLTEVYSWFSKDLVINLNSSIPFSLNYTKNKFEKEPKFREFVLKYLNKGDLGGISEIKNEEQDLELPKYMPEKLKQIIEESEKFRFKTYHKDDVGKTVLFDLKNEESLGTIKYLSLLGPIYDMIENNRVFIVDELDQSLHPEILKFIFEIIHNSNNYSQIISTTHAFPLLLYVNNDSEVFRRDEIWFTKKKKDGSTKLYSLIQIGGLNRNEDILRIYFEGRLEAFPYIS